MVCARKHPHSRADPHGRYPSVEQVRKGLCHGITVGPDHPGRGRPADYRPDRPRYWPRRSGAVSMTTTQVKPPPVIWMTFMDSRDHAVRDDDVAGCRTGIYDTVCGARLLPAPSQAPPRPDCQCCGAFLLAWTRMRPASQRIGQPPSRHKHARSGWFARLLSGQRRRNQ